VAEVRGAEADVEQTAEAYTHPTEDGRGWLERRPRLGTALAVWGVVSGLACLILPGVLALRSMWHARRRGETPDGAWLVGLFTIWLAIAAGVWLLVPVGAIFVGIVGFFVSAVLINRNPSRG
jgi:hypothetical protein